METDAAFYEAMTTLHLYNVVLKGVFGVCGTFIVWIGYRLFEKGVFRGGAGLEVGAEGAEATAGSSWKAVLRMDRGGPGLIFAAAGAAVITFGIWKDFSLSGEAGSISTRNVTDGAPRSSVGDAGRQALEPTRIGPRLNSNVRNEPGEGELPRPFPYQAIPLDGGETMANDPNIPSQGETG